MKAVLVAGSRSWTDRTAIEERIAANETGEGTHVLIHGAARGADRIADRVARERGWHVETYPANWSRFHKKAGPIRNRVMVERLLELFAKGTTVAVEAFLDADSRGTRHTIKIAREAGLKVHITDDPDDPQDHEFDL